MQTLGLSHDEFWSLTPRQFSNLVEEYERKEQRADFRAGVIGSILANIYRDKQKRAQPYTPQDLFPSLHPTRGQKVPATKEELRDGFESLKNMGLVSIRKRKKRKRQAA